MQGQMSPKKNLGIVRRSVSISELIDAMHFGDFYNSTRILSEFQIDESFVHLSYELRRFSEGEFQNPLMIRDHVLHYLGGFPIYVGLDISSYELLETLNYTKNQEQARNEFLKLVRLLFADNDQRLLHYHLEISELADNHFIMLLTDLLDRRSNEIKSLRIPYSSIVVGGSKKERFLISGLAQTAYGRKILTALGVPEENPVVGTKIWSQIASAMSEIGYDSSSMLDPVSETDWAGLTANMTSAKTSPSRELGDLAILRRVLANFDSADANVRVVGLDQFRDLRTVSYLGKIATIARGGSIEEQCLALDILGEIGSEEHDSLLTALLNSENLNVRARAAKAISRMSARDFLKESRISLEKSTGKMQKEYHAVIDSITLEPKNRFERLDAAKLYLSIYSPEADARFHAIYDRLEVASKYKLLDYALSLNRIRAEILVKKALLDDDPLIREAAERIGRQIWPSESWDNDFDEMDEEIE